MPDGGVFAAELYERHRGPLMRLAVHLAGGDRHCAEGLAQETILRAWQHRDVIRPGQERAWLAVPARNLAIDGYRRGAGPPEPGGCCDAPAPRRGRTRRPGARP